MCDFAEVIRKIRNHKAVIFWGAGASLKAGAPSVGSIVKHLKSKLATVDDGQISSDDLSEVAQLFEDIFGRDALISELKSLVEFTPTNIDDQRCLTCIPQIPRIYTTNYDNLLETAFADDGQVIRINQDAADIDESKKLIIKLHGDLVDVSDIILTKNDYMDYWHKPKNELVWNMLKSDFANRHIVFIGYSLSDYNVFSLLQKIREISGLNPKGHYLISPNIPEYKIQKLSKYGVSYIKGTAEDLFSELFSVFDNELHKDLKTKKITADEMNKYTSKRHDFYSDITSTPIRNSIGLCHSNIETKTNISFTVTAEKKEFFDKDNLPRYNSYFKSGSFTLPCTKLSTPQLKNIAITFNDFRIADAEDISQLLIAPSVKERRFVISVPTYDFKEKVKAIVYKNGDSVICDMDCVIFHIQMSFKQDNSAFPQLTVVFNEYFTSLSTAKHWTLLYKAIECNEILSFISEDGTVDIGNRTPNSPRQGLHSEKMFEYYKIIDQLEDKANIDFAKYDAYTEELLEMTQLALSAVSGNWVNVPLDKPLYLTTEFEPNENQDLINGLECGKTYLFGTTEELLNEKFELFGHTFPVKFKEKAFPHSTLEYIKSVGHGRKKIKIKIEGQYMIRSLYKEEDKLIK